MVGFNVNLDVGMAGREAIQPRQQPLANDRTAGIDPQPCLLGRTHAVKRLSDLQEGFAERGLQTGASMRQLHRSGFTLEKRDSNIRFQGLDVLTDRSRRYLQLFRGPFEGAKTGGRFKGAHTRKGRQTSERHKAFFLMR